MSEEKQLDRDQLVMAAIPFVAFASWVLYNVYYSCFVLGA